MHYDSGSEAGMSKRELIVRELDRLPEQDLDRLPYIFGPFRDEDIQVLKQRAQAARRLTSIASG